MQKPCGWRFGIHPHLVCARGERRLVVVRCTNKLSVSLCESECDSNVSLPQVQFHSQGADPVGVPPYQQGKNDHP